MHLQQSLMPLYLQAFFGGIGLASVGMLWQRQRIFLSGFVLYSKDKCLGLETR